MLNRFNLTPDEEAAQALNELTWDQLIPRELCADKSDAAELAELAELSGLIEVTTEDRLRGAIVEALHWLDMHAEGRAYAALLEALKIRSLKK